MKCPVRATTRAVYVGTFQIDGATDLRGATQRKDISKRKMPVTIGVKWGKNAYDVEVDTSGVGLDLKTQLFSLTGVPPERIKVMGL